MIVQCIRLILALVLLSVCSYTDIQYRKVKNYVTFPVFFIGTFICILTPEKDLLPVAIGFVLYAAFGYLHLMAMGDSKFLIALTAIYGLKFSFFSMLIGVAANFLYALFTDVDAVILAIKNVKNFVLYHTPVPTKDKTRYPFTVFISIGAVILLVLRAVT